MLEENMQSVIIFFNVFWMCSHIRWASEPKRQTRHIQPDMSDMCWKVSICPVRLVEFVWVRERSVYSRVIATVIVSHPFLWYNGPRAPSFPPCYDTHEPLTLATRGKLLNENPSHLWDAFVEKTIHLAALLRIRLKSWCQAAFPASAGGLSNTARWQLSMCSDCHGAQSSDRIPPVWVSSVWWGFGNCTYRMTTVRPEQGMAKSRWCHATKATSVHLVLRFGFQWSSSCWRRIVAPRQRATPVVGHSEGNIELRGKVITLQRPSSAWSPQPWRQCQDAQLQPRPHGGVVPVVPGHLPSDGRCQDSAASAAAVPRQKSP